VSHSSHYVESDENRDVSLVKFHLADSRGSVSKMTGVDGYAGDSVTSMTVIITCFIRKV
jgi:hypothetical protein